MKVEGSLSSSSSRATDGLTVFTTLFPRDAATLIWLSGQTKARIEKSFHQTRITKSNEFARLLDAFHLSTNETLESKDRRFREFVWLVIVAWKVSWGYTWNFLTRASIYPDMFWGAPIIVYLLITHVLRLYATLFL